MLYYILSKRVFSLILAYRIWSLTSVALSVNAIEKMALEGARESEPSGKTKSELVWNFWFCRLNFNEYICLTLVINDKWLNIHCNCHYNGYSGIAQLCDVIAMRRSAITSHCKGRFSVCALPSFVASQHGMGALPGVMGCENTDPKIGLHRKCTPRPVFWVAMVLIWVGHLSVGKDWP